MKRDPRFTQGYMTAWKDAVEWLHRRAIYMNDPKASQVLYSAAFNLGANRKFRGRASITDQPGDRPSWMEPMREPSPASSPSSTGEEHGTEA